MDDRDLTAYLDGTLDAGRAREIEAQLAHDDALDARLRALDPLAPAVRAAMDAAGAPQTAAVAAAPRPAPRSAGAAALAAALVLGLGLGWGGSMVTQGTEAPGWRMQVAQYQALYVPETVAHAQTDTLDAQFDRADAALAAPLPRAVFKSVDGLELRRVQVLGFKGKPLIQIAYRDAAGTPFALCLMAGEDDTRADEMLAGLASSSWSAGGQRFILIGGTDLDRVGALAAPLQSALAL